MPTGISFQLKIFAQMLKMPMSILICTRNLAQMPIMPMKYDDFPGIKNVPKCPKCPWAFWFPVLATTEFCPNAQKAHGHFRLYSEFCSNAHTAHDDRQFCKTSTLCPNAHIAHGHLVKAYRLCPNAYGHLAPTVVGIDIRPKCPKCPWAF